MEKISFGISNYEKLVTEGYYYIDKTKYIEQLENLSERYIIFLRPSKFGKTLFTSVLENYYDIKKKDKFEELFKNTYIGKNPTKSRNKNYILKFDFTNIDKENILESFKNIVINEAKKFGEKYNIELNIKENLSAELILNEIFLGVNLKNIKEEKRKIYVIIDGYDSFVNKFFDSNVKDINKLIEEINKIKYFYAILKEGTESVVDRIFITGELPINLDGFTSGFNIASDLTQNRNFNEMMGFTKEEIIKLINSQKIEKEKQEKLLKVIKENYGGYRFSKDAKEKVCNPNMCLYFLNKYLENEKILNELIEINNINDYKKLEKLLSYFEKIKVLDIVGKVTIGKGEIVNIVRQFNIDKEFGKTKILSLLYYFGYLTIIGEDFGDEVLKAPNEIMKVIYSKSVLKVF